MTVYFNRIIVEMTSTAIPGGAVAPKLDCEAIDQEFARAVVEYIQRRVGEQVAAKRADASFGGISM